MDVQARYWQEFADLKRDARYIDLYHARTEKIDRMIGGFTAITSSSSIAAWAIWKQFSFFWGLLIAASQLMAATKEFLPFKQRLRALRALSPELNGLALAAENDWFKVSRGLLTEEEIHDLHMALKKKKQDATQKYFPAASLPEARDLLARADKDIQMYLSNYFGAADG